MSETKNYKGIKFRVLGAKFNLLNNQTYEILGQDDISVFYQAQNLTIRTLITDVEDYLAKGWWEMIPEVPNEYVGKTFAYKNFPKEVFTVTEVDSGRVRYIKLSEDSTSLNRFEYKVKQGEFVLVEYKNDVLEEAALNIVKEELELSGVRKHTCINGVGYSQLERNIAKRILSLINKQ